MHVASEYRRRGTDGTRHLHLHHRRDDGRLVEAIAEQQEGFVATCRGARAQVEEILTARETDAANLGDAADGTKLVRELRSLLSEL